MRFCHMASVNSNRTPGFKYVMSHSAHTGRHFHASSNGNPRVFAYSVSFALYIVDHFRERLFVVLTSIKSGLSARRRRVVRPIRVSRRG